MKRREEAHSFTLKMWTWKRKMTHFFFVVFLCMASFYWVENRICVEYLVHNVHKIRIPIYLINLNEAKIAKVAKVTNLKGATKQLRSSAVFCPLFHSQNVAYRFSLFIIFHLGLSICYIFYMRRHVYAMCIRAFNLHLNIQWYEFVELAFVVTSPQ